MTDTIETQREQLLNHLHRGGAWGYWWTFPEKRSTWWPVGKPASLPQAENVYFGVHPTAQAGTSGTRSKVATVAAVNCVYAEFDFKDYPTSLDCMHIATQLDPLPSVLVKSGGGYHCYWLLRDTFAITDDAERRRADDLQKAWVAHVGGDDGAKDLARVLRVPGTTNGKYSPAPLVTFQWAEFGRLYEFEQLEALCKPTEAAVTVQVGNNHHPTTDLQSSSDFWLEKYLQQAHIGNRNKAGALLARQLRDSARISVTEAMAVPYPERVPQAPGDVYTRAAWKATVKSIYKEPPGDTAKSQSSSRNSAETVEASHPPSDSSPPVIGQAESAEGKKKNVKSAEYVAVLKSLDYQFRMNECSDRVEVNGEPISDAVESVISSKLRDAGYPHVNVARDAYIADAYYNSYHPVRDYLADLPPGETGHIARLASYFDNPDGTLGTWLKRWLIGAVRRAYEPGEQNRVLVLDGPQNIGKSKFVEWLAPDPLRGKHYRSGPIYPDDKDCRIALTERWIWEVAELGSTTRRTDREALKFFISLELVTMRPPYGRYEIQKPALSNFIGTVNNEHGLLSDPTGNRRYMFSKINGIDWRGYMHSIDVTNIWAEALLLYLAGEPADLTREEIAQAEAINKSYQVEEPLEGVLMEHFEVDPSQYEWWTSTADIIQELEDPAYDTNNKPTKPTYRNTSMMTSKLLASLMTELGCERKKSRPRHGAEHNPVWGYVGVRKL